MKKHIITIFLVLIIGQVMMTQAEVDAITMSSFKSIEISLINQDPDPAIAGDILELRLGIENNGGKSAENIVVELIPDYPFTLLSEDDAIQKIGTINAYQQDNDMKILKYKLRVDRDAVASEYNLDIKEYTDGTSSSSTRTITIEVQNKESAEVIYIDKVELIPGKITPMTFTINNVGSAPLEDMSFQWENEDDIVLPVGSDNTKYIKYIAIGDSVDLKFDVIASASADPDLYKLDLVLKYDDPLTGEKTNITTKAGIYVGGATDFDAAFSGVSNNEASFSISNIGSVSASSVTVKIPDQPSWRVQGSNSVIIGNLNEGDYTIASFNLQQKSQINPTQAAQRPSRDDSSQQTKSMEDPTVLLEIVYTDTRGNRNTIEKEVGVDSSAFMTSTDSSGAPAQFSGRTKRPDPMQQVWNTVKWIIAGVVLLVLLIFARRKYKKEKQKNNNYTYKQMLKELLNNINYMKLKKKKSK